MSTSESNLIEKYVSEIINEGWLSIDHEEILDTAIKSAADPSDVPLVETLHQNIAHMTVALKEVETRMIRVINKMNRLGITETDQFVLPLTTSVATLKAMILETERHLEYYSNNKCLARNHDE